MPFTYVKVTAAEEPNRISVVTSEGGVTVADVGAVLRGVGDAGASPRVGVLPAARSDRCGTGRRMGPPLAFAHVGIYPGGGDDEAVVSLHKVDTDGVLTGAYSDIFTVDVRDGPGDDRITLPAAAETSAYGEGGEDTLIGGENLLGGTGNDHLTGIEFDSDKLAYEWFTGGAGKDVIRGGAGHTNVATYGGSTPVHVDLRRAGGQGRSGEGDTLVEMDGAAGGTGADVLIGNRNGNVLYGGYATT